jgi:hypothetical protein
MKKGMLLIVAILSTTVMGCFDNEKAPVENIDASIDSCPAERPTFPYPSCSGNQACGYGLECCCGTCLTAFMCNCVNGSYECVDTGVCDNPWCEDAGADGG